MAPEDRSADLTRAETGGADPGRADPSRVDCRLEFSRRDFLKTIGVTSVAATVAGNADPALLAQRAAPSRVPAGAMPDSAGYMAIRQEVSENLTKRGIVGYADHLHVQPGETIKFMVSSEAPRYRCDIVQLIHGDENPKGPGIKEVVVETPANREYAGRHQELPLGSYAIVADNPAL